MTSQTPWEHCTLDPPLQYILFSNNHPAIDCQALGDRPVARDRLVGHPWFRLRVTYRGVLASPLALVALGDACVFLTKTSQLLNVIFQNFAGMFPNSSTIVFRYSSTAVLLYFHNVDGHFVASSIGPIRHNPLRFKMAAPNISEAWHQRETFAL